MQRFDFVLRLERVKHGGSDQQVGEGAHNQRERADVLLLHDMPGRRTVGGEMSPSLSAGGRSQSLDQPLGAAHSHWTSLPLGADGCSQPDAGGPSDTGGQHHSSTQRWLRSSGHNYLQHGGQVAQRSRNKTRLIRKSNLVTTTRSVQSYLQNVNLAQFDNDLVRNNK